jgi:hypothetical protein
VVAVAAVCMTAAGGDVSAADVCGGTQPHRGAVLHGPILDIPNSTTLCVALGPLPSAWVAVHPRTIAATRSALMAAAFGKNATCTVDGDGEADCLIEGRPLTEALTRPHVDAAAWR